MPVLLGRMDVSAPRLPSPALGPKPGDLFAWPKEAVGGARSLLGVPPSTDEIPEEVQHARRTGPVDICSFDTQTRLGPKRC
jgi:hypothetical protein